MNKYMTKEQRIERDRNMKVEQIPVKAVKDNPYQPRKKYRNIKKFAVNISRHGLINPVNVVSVNHGTEYVLISGHRRLRAFKYLNRETIPATIRASIEKEDLALLLAIENARREDFTVIEKCYAIFNALNTNIPNINNDYLRCLILINQIRLVERRGKIGGNFVTKLGFEELDLSKCRRILDDLNLSENTAIAYLRLLDLPKEIQKKIVYSNNDITNKTKKDGSLSVKAGYELTRIKDNELRLKIYKEFCKKGLTYTNLKYIINTLLEEGEEGFSKIGRNKKRDADDYGLSYITEKNFHHASLLWNWRGNKLRPASKSLDDLYFKSSLLRLRKSSLFLVDSINKILEKTEEDEKINLINKQLSITIKAGTHGQKFRFGFPAKYGKELGLKPDDQLELKIVSIKRKE